MGQIGKIQRWIKKELGQMTFLELSNLPHPTIFATSCIYTHTYVFPLVFGSYVSNKRVLSLTKLIYIPHSILVLRQTLVMEQMVSNHEDMESTIVACSAQLSKILDTVIDAGLEELVEVLSKITERFDTADDSTKTQSRRNVMARILRKSVQAGDPVFVKVSRAVYLATRGVVLGGSGNHGRKLAEKALRQVGSAVLTDKLVEAAVVLGVMTRVSENVHGLWYARLIENM